MRFCYAYWRNLRVWRETVPFDTNDNMLWAVGFYVTKVLKTKDQTHASALRFIYICTPADRWASNVNIFDIFNFYEKYIYIYLIYFRTWGIFGLFFYKDINLNFNYCMLISVVPSKTSTCVYIIVATYWSDCNCI